MTDNSRTLHVLAVGGSSRAAQAFRRAASETALRLTTLARSPISGFPNERIVSVADHFAPPAECFDGVDVVINFAGMTQGSDGPALVQANVEGPKRLAEAAKREGVRYFIQLSSVHIYGQAPYISRSTAEKPHTAYGRSKQAADRVLAALSADDFVVTMLRLPVLYGGGAGDNLRRLGAMMARLGWFPVLRTPGRKSVLHVGNLAAILLELVHRPKGGVQFAADIEPLTLDLLANVAAHQLGRPITLIPVPRFALFPLAMVARGFYNRLYGDNLIAQAECTDFSSSNPVPLREGLKDLFV